MSDKAYSYEELGELKRQILDICERVRQDNPTAWKDAHNGNFDETSTRYNDLCVQALRAAGIFAGCNGKRGGDQRSDDVLDFGLTDNRGARDMSGRFQSIAIIDYINGAGGPNPSIGWNDVSSAAAGKFLDPQGLARVDGGVVTPPGPPQDPPPSTDPGVPPPSPEMDFRTLNAKLDALLTALDDVKNAQAASDVRQVINEALRADDIMGHIRRELNDIKNKPSEGGARCNFPRLRGVQASQIAAVLSDPDPDAPEQA